MPIKHAYVLQLNADSADFHFYQLDDIDKSFNLFLHLLELYSLRSDSLCLLKPLLPYFYLFLLYVS